jgi:hypothetical protein
VVNLVLPKMLLILLLQLQMPCNLLWTLVLKDIPSMPKKNNVYWALLIIQLVLPLTLIQVSVQNAQMEMPFILPQFKIDHKWELLYVLKLFQDVKNMLLSVEPYNVLIVVLLRKDMFPKLMNITQLALMIRMLFLTVKDICQAITQNA